MNNTYFDDIINELTLQELQETICSNTYYMLDEGEGVLSWLGDIGRNVGSFLTFGLIDSSTVHNAKIEAAKPLWKKFTKNISGMWDNVKGWFGKFNIMDQLKNLKDYLSNGKNLTTVGLAGAGLLGAYYLAKKFLGKKKLDRQDFQYAARIQQLQPNQLPPNIANQQIG